MNEIPLTSYDVVKAQYNVFLDENTQHKCKPQICSSLHCVHRGKKVTDEPCSHCWFVAFDAIAEGD
jgi:hypothetical protein